MGTHNWQNILGWGTEQLQDLRFTGFSYIQQGKYDIALSLFRALVVLNPSSSYDVQTLGALYLELNQLELAEATLKQALDLDPSHAQTCLNYAKILFQKGQREAGLEQLTYLDQHSEPYIANIATALKLAYE